MASGDSYSKGIDWKFGHGVNKRHAEKVGKSKKSKIDAQGDWGVQIFDCRFPLRVY